MHFPQDSSHIEGYLSILQKRDEKLVSLLRMDKCVDVLINNLDDIIVKYDGFDEYYLREYKEEFISYFRKMDLPTNIPRKHLTHVLMNCHLNVGISLLSSLTYLLRLMTEVNIAEHSSVENNNESSAETISGNPLVKNNDEHSSMNTNENLSMKNNSKPPSSETIGGNSLVKNNSESSSMKNTNESNNHFFLLRDTLIEAINCTRNYRPLMLQLAKSLDINIRELDEADVTFKKLMTVINKYIPKDIIQYWDSFEDDIHQLIGKHQPLYFICNVQDFNTVLGVESPLVKATTFRIHPEVSYKLHAIIVYNSHHFFNAYIDNKWIIRDCIPRCNESRRFDKLSDYIDADCHSIACYIKVH